MNEKARLEWGLYSRNRTDRVMHNALFEMNT